MQIELPKEKKRVVSIVDDEEEENYFNLTRLNVVTE
jgi:hypothetical protein